jgi:hypothetical protein
MVTIVKIIHPILRAVVLLDRHTTRPQTSRAMIGITKNKVTTKTGCGAGACNLFAKMRRTK